MVMISPWFISLIVVVAIWEMIWKGIGMWRAGRNNQLGWFVAILIFNTVGLLPLIYLGWFQKKESLKSKIVRRIKRRR